MKNKKQKLPDKPSELLMVAMEDLEKVENNPKYKLDMSQYYVEGSSKNDKCRVCHAGAVMANTLKSSSLERVTAYNRLVIDPDDFDFDTERKLVAIDHIREGFIEDFFDELGIKPPESLIRFKNFVGTVLEEDVALKCAHYNEEYIDRISRSRKPEVFQEYKNWIVGFIGILQAEGL